MKQKFVGNLVFVIVINILIKPLWVFGIDLHVQNTLGAQAYGLYFSLVNFTLIFNVLLDLGLTNYTNRHVSRYGFLAGKYLSYVILIRFILGVIYAIFIFILAVFLNYSHQAFYLLIFLVINQFLASTILYFRANIAGLQLLSLDSLLSVTDRILMILFAGLMLLFFEPYFNIEAFVLIQTIAYAITALLVFTLLKRKIGKISLKFKPLYAWVVIKRSLPFALLTVLMAAYSRADAVLLLNMLPDGALHAGLYARAFRIPEAFSIIPFLFAGLLLPIFSKMLKNEQSIYEIIRTALGLLFVPMGIFVCTAVVWSTEIMHLLYPAEALENISYRFLFLMLSLIPVSLNYIFGTLLTAAGKLKTLNYIALIILLVNLAMNIVLIPVYKSNGAAFASFITNLAAFGLQLAFSGYYFGVGTYFKQIFKGVLLLLVVFITSWQFKTHISSSLYAIGILIPIFTIIASVVKLINLNDLKGVFQLKNFK